MKRLAFLLAVWTACVLAVSIESAKATRPFVYPVVQVLTTPHSHPTYCGKRTRYYERAYSWWTTIHKLTLKAERLRNDNLIRWYTHRVYWNGSWYYVDTFRVLCGGIR